GRDVGQELVHGGEGTGRETVNAIVVQPRGRLAVHEPLAGARRVDAGGEVQERALPRAAPADDRGEAAGPDVEREPVERAHAARSGRKRLHNAIETQRRELHGPRLSRTSPAPAGAGRGQWGRLD